MKRWGDELSFHRSAGDSVSIPALELLWASPDFCMFVISFRI